MVEILTARCRLRPMVDADFPALCRYLQDPEVMYAYGHAFSDREVWDWLRRQQARYVIPGYGALALELRATGRMIGQCGITLQDCGGVTFCDAVGDQAVSDAVLSSVPADEEREWCADEGDRPGEAPAEGLPDRDAARPISGGEAPEAAPATACPDDGPSRSLDGHPRDLRLPEVGYLLAKGYWHHGYATESARACMEFAFDVLGVPEVFSCIRDSNAASLAVARRNGMRLCGRFSRHYHGQDMEHLLYVARREDWRP